MAKMSKSMAPKSMAPKSTASKAVAPKSVASKSAMPPMKKGGMVGKKSY